MFEFDIRKLKFQDVWDLHNHETSPSCLSWGIFSVIYEVTGGEGE